MSAFADPTAVWAGILIIALPLLIIGMGELEERLRQRDSPNQRTLGIVRTWVLPLLAIWALVQVLLDPADDDVLASLLGSALVIAVGAAALAFVATVVAAIRERPRGDGRRAVPRLLLAMPRLLVLLTIVWLLLAGVWDVDLSAALTALGVTSLVVSFALQDTLGGIASGFTLLADQPFQPGDWIRAGDVEGRVLDINWRSSRVRTRDGDLVVVPNGVLAAGTITNYDEPTRHHRVVVPVQVAYANSPTRAKEMLVSAARATAGVLESPAPVAVVVQVDDPLMGYEVHMWVDDYAIVPRVASDFGSLVWYHSHRLDVPLPSPAQDLYLWDGPRTAAEGRREHSSIVTGLSDTPLLSALPADDLDALAAAARPVRFAGGETVLPPGADHLVVVEAGTARLEAVDASGEPVPVSDVGAGELVGVLGLDPPAGWRVAVTAATDCDVIELPADAAGEVISRSPELTAAIDQLTTSRGRRLHRTVRQLHVATSTAPRPDALPDGSRTTTGDGRPVS